MNNLLDRIKQAWRGFMTGRHGMDQLSLALVWVGLILYILDMFLGTGVFTLLSLAAYGYAIFRMLSRNSAKRREENQKYMAFTHTLRTKWNQARARFQNRKAFKYFRCPNCRTWIRLPRGTGKVTVTCRNCGNRFEKEA